MSRSKSNIALSLAAGQLPEGFVESLALALYMAQRSFPEDAETAGDYDWVATAIGASLHQSGWRFAKKPPAPPDRAGPAPSET